jgi:hypothetical protein
LSPRFAAPGFLRLAFILASSLALADAAYSASRADDDADLSTLLKRQTQAFSEAGRRGDAATINRYLDRDVVFTNETGAIATKKELVEGTTPTPANAQKRRIEVTKVTVARSSSLSSKPQFWSHHSSN